MATQGEPPMKTIYAHKRDVAIWLFGTTNNYYELDLVKNIVIKKNKKTFKYIFKKDRNQMFVDYKINIYFV